MPEQARTVTYVKLIAAMAMWGGTWIAGRVIAQELSAPLAVAVLAKGGAHGQGDEGAREG